MNTHVKPSIVFVHGLWADGSCFSKVIPLLQAEGHDVIAAQYGLDTVDGDVAAVKRTIGRVGGGNGPVILVGHSYGGAVISAAGTDERVAGLVYIAAVAPEAGESVNDQIKKFPTEVFQHIEVAEGRVWLKPSGVACFAGDLPEDVQRVVWATHFPPAADLLDQKIRSAAWKTKPSWYVIGKKDRTVHPDLQRFLAKRMGATVTEVESSHVPMLSMPGAVVDVIRAAANAARRP